jgi:hypothetical protein
MPVGFPPEQTTKLILLSIILIKPAGYPIIFFWKHEKAPEPRSFPCQLCLNSITFAPGKGSGRRIIGQHCRRIQLKELEYIFPLKEQNLSHKAYRSISDLVQ